MEVPRVHDDVVGTGALDEDGDVAVIRLGLGERVVQGDVDVIAEGLVGVQLGDHDAVAVLVEEVGEADHHDVVVIDQRNEDR